jgi:hypothetical protein
MGMPAVTRNITIEQGAIFRDEFSWHADSETTPGTPGDPIPLTGATVRMQIRKKQGTDVLLEASSPDDGITLVEAAGQVKIEISAALTSMLPVKGARYDLEAVFSPDEVHRLTEGSVTVRPNITQDEGEPVLS